MTRPPVAVRPAREADRVQVVTTLARAFQDDPVMDWVNPDPDDRRRRLPRLFDLQWSINLPLGGCDTTEGHEAATFWRPPDQWHIPQLTMLLHAVQLFDSFGWRIGRALKVLGAMEKRHPQVPHWYLMTVGTEPSQQGRGYGGAVIRSRLDRCDAEAMPAYLESSNPTYVPIYHALGFEVIEEIRVADAPPLYAMWREPRR